tara:strand:+ start:2220 stop:2426 length:207 start_codon:yes stop_codon:yes gene_type:complete
MKDEKKEKIIQYEVHMYVGDDAKPHVSVYPDFMYQRAKAQHEREKKDHTTRPEVVTKVQFFRVEYHEL